MIKIKLSNNFSEWPLLRQTPKSSGIWEDCIFFLNQDIEECDYWVVYDNLLKEESVMCSPENTILITAEPPSVARYNKNFLAQFHLVVTCHPDLEHSNVIHNQQGLPWHIGRYQQNHKNLNFTKNYDNLKQIFAFEKKKEISVISSAKTDTKGHKKRVDFVKKLSAYYGKKVDIFGRGIKEIGDKWDAIADYKYHIVIENSSYINYWTEKLSDAFLAGAYPLYYGCPNLSDYFPAEAFTSIDINDFDEAVVIINSVINSGKYEQSREQILFSRNLVLDKYNLFPLISNICRKQTVKDKSRVVLKPEFEFEPGYSKVITKSKVIPSKIIKNIKKIMGNLEK